MSYNNSVQFSHSVVSDSLQPHELQHAMPPCPSPTAGVHPNPCPLTGEWIKKLWYIYTMEYSVQFSPAAQSCLTLCDPLNLSKPGLPVHHQLLEFIQTLSIESVMPSNQLILCCPLLLLPSFFPRIRVFSNESALRFRWLKYWSFSFNISPSNEYSGLISFRMDWWDLLAVQGTLKSQ